MNRRISGISIPLFFFLPWIGFLLSLLNFRSKASAFLYVAFATLIGYSISFTDTSIDSFRYAQSFKLFDSTLDYNKLVQMYWDGGQRDIYRLLLFYFTSIFSDNPKVLFAIAGFIYGIISYLCLSIFVRNRGKSWDIFIFALCLIFYTFCALSNINGFRFWTGGLLLFYASYNFIILKKNIWVLGLLMTPLIHFGFALIVPLLIFYRFIHPFLYSSHSVSPILLYSFIITFFFSWLLGTNAINIGFLSQLSPFSGSVGNRIDFLNSDDVAELVENKRQTSLFLSVRQYFDYAIKIYVFIIILFLNNVLKKIKGNKRDITNIFSFVLFFYSFAFIAASFPSGSRFLNIAHLFFIILMCKFYLIYKRPNYKRLILLAVPIFSFNIAFINIMLPIMMFSPVFWYGNIFWILIEGIGFTV